MSVILPKEVGIIIPDEEPKMNGFIKIWKSSPITGESQLLVDKKNTILYSGSDLLAKSLGGQVNTKISHMYLGYSNNVSVPDNTYVISKSNGAFVKDGDRGYLRVPLTFPASYLTEDNYANNIVVFTVLINNASGFVVSGSATLTNSTSKFFEIALASALDPTATVNDHVGKDMVFSRVAFERIAYDSTFNLTISWGVKFTS